MPHRHPHLPQNRSGRWPRLWLLTDERMGDTLIPSVMALPKGAGLVFRHYGLAPKARAALLRRIGNIARRRRQVMTIGGISHGRHRGAVTAPVHTVRERIAAERAGAQLLFVSPVFATRSHPGAKALGRVRFGLITRGARCPVIALGGMTARRARSLEHFGIYGWAAIDGLSRQTGQKRNAVPT